MKKLALAFVVGFFALPNIALAQFPINFDFQSLNGISAFGVNTQKIRFVAPDGYEHHLYNTPANASGSHLKICVQNPITNACNEALTITSDGLVGIGGPFYNIVTTPGALFPTDILDYRLYVRGGIRTDKVKVDIGTGTWGDFVFSPNYKLMPLTELQKYINAHQHLPEIPSAKEIEQKGIDVGEMQRLQMIKIEELTLYLLQLKEENEKLRERLEKLEKQAENEQN